MNKYTSLTKRIKTVAANNRFAAKVIAEYQYLKFQKKPTSYENLQKTLDTFVSPEQRADKTYMKKLEKDLLFSKLYYQIAYNNYFLYAFEKLSDCGRKQFVGALELENMYRQLNATGKPDVFRSKYNTYEHFKKYYRREIVLIQDGSQEEAFIRFVTKHNPCILKPLRDYGGHGIERISVDGASTTEQIFEKHKAKMPLVLEEMIVQDPAMARFHPQSVNTIRYNTFFYEGTLTRLQAVLRMGRGGSFVDNRTSGGVYALVDVDTGIIISPARNELREEYLYHPTTGEQILGAHIPRWDELNVLLEEVVRVIPEQKQVGWDFALTKDGWVMIEGNTGPALQSFDITHGLRDQINKTFVCAIEQEKQ